MSFDNVGISALWAISAIRFKGRREKEWRDLPLRGGIFNVGRSPADELMLSIDVSLQIVLAHLLATKVRA